MEPTPARRKRNRFLLALRAKRNRNLVLGGVSTAALEQDSEAGETSHSGLKEEVAGCLSRPPSLCRILEVGIAPANQFATPRDNAFPNTSIRPQKPRNKSFFETDLPDNGL